MVRFSIQSLVLRLFLMAVGTLGLTETAWMALANDASQEQDVKAITKFLAMFEGKTWESGPTRITNKAIEAAYPGMRFYYVFSSPAARRADKNKLSQVFQLDKRGHVGFVSRSEGLTKIGGDKDAKVAAAAIMSLRIGEDGLLSVDANEVQVSRKDTNWVCKAMHDGCFFEVVFDRDGEYVSMSAVSRIKGDGGRPNGERGKSTLKPKEAGKGQQMGEKNE